MVIGQRHQHALGICLALWCIGALRDRQAQRELEHAQDIAFFETKLDKARDDLRALREQQRAGEP